ncbi:glutathione S-transferase family protein [Dyella sp. A6]|uniref:glutathione S-transferase family protein n=1 Tax=Dyella aluminiiresistens TaxID=3069105 RepID=UPI002E77BCFC|nr:glutathione S-transferase family protein [Dyella sp. A6]
MNTIEGIVLHGSNPGFGLPEASPFVIKTDVQLQLAGLPYRKVGGTPPQAPKGKIPWLVDGDETVCDSTFIRAHLERKYSIDLDAGLDARQRAESWAIERMLEDHLYWTMVWFRWIDPVNFAKGPAHFVDAAPEAARASLREELQARRRAELHAQGLGRHTADQIAMLGQRSLDALSTLLDDRAHVTGRQPAAVDAFAFGMLASILTPFFDSPLRDAALGYPNLVAYTARMMQRHYPEHPWTASA